MDYNNKILIMYSYTYITTYLKLRIKSLFFFNIFFFVVLDLRCFNGFSLIPASGGHSHCSGGFSLHWLLSFCSTGSRVHWFQQFHLLGSRALAQELRLRDLIAPQHVGSYRTRQQTMFLALASGFFAIEPPGKL